MNKKKVNMTHEKGYLCEMYDKICKHINFNNDYCRKYKKKIKSELSKGSLIIYFLKLAECIDQLNPKKRGEYE